MKNRMSTLIRRWLFLHFISLLMFQDCQSFFLRHTLSGMCIAKGALINKDSRAERYYAEIVDNCMNVSAQFRYTKTGERLKSVGPNGGTLVSDFKEQSYNQRLVVYKHLNSRGKKFEKSTNHNLKQTPQGSLYLNKVNSCVQPSGNYVNYIENGCKGTKEQNFSFGSVTNYNSKMKNVHCSSKQRMVIKRASYGNFNNGGTFDYDASVDTKCSSLTTCKLKNMCGGNRSCLLTVNSNLLSQPYCTTYNKYPKELYTEYTCVDPYNSAIITEGPNIRLSGTPNEGFIEIKDGKLWRMVNDKNWDKDRQKMLCQHLGFHETHEKDTQHQRRRMQSEENIASGDFICYYKESGGTSCCVYLEPSTITSSKANLRYLPYVTCKICDKPLLQDESVFPHKVFGTSSDQKDARFSSHGWCTSWSKPKYLLIDLQNEYHITQVVTMGKRSQPSGSWSESYSMKYSHDKALVDRRRGEQIRGNTNGYQASITTLDIYNVKHIKIESTGRKDFCLRIQLCGEVQKPAPVTKILATTFIRSVRISWIIPDPESSSYITQYIIYLNGKKHRILSRKVRRNHFTLSRLDPYTEYTVGIKTQDGSLQKSQKISEVKFKTNEGVPSDPPKRVHFTSRTKNTLGLSWQAPDTHSLNGELNGYQICYSTKENDKNEKCFTITATRLSCTIGNLQSSTIYFVTVAAGTSAGYGKKSGEIYRKTIGVPSGSPKGVRFIYQKKNSLRLFWESPEAHLLNGPLEGYQICYSTKENDENAKCSTIATTAWRYSFTIDNLKTSTKYFVTVAAGTSAGYGKRSKEIYTKTIGVPSGSPKDVRFRYRRTDLLRLSWGAPDAHLLNGKLTGYKICYSTQENDKHPSKYGKCYIIMSTNTNYSYSIRHLLSFTKYFVTVAAGTSVGFGVKSAEISKTTFPNGEPVNLDANSYSTLKINITKPANYIKEVMVVVQTATRKTTPSKYIYTGNLKPYQAYRRDPYYVAASFAASVLPLTFVIGDGKLRDFGTNKYINHPLNQGTNYTVFLRFFESQDSFYSTDWSKSVRTMIKPPVPSGSPRNVCFRYRKKNSLSISWESPDAHLLNGELKGYKICYSTKENDKNSKCFTILTTTTRYSCTIGNLKSSTRYFVTVAAGTSAGYGKRSREIYTETIGVPSGSPKNVRVRYRRKNSLSISWDSPDAHLLNRELKGYKICYSTKENDKNAKCFTIPTTDTKYSYTINNLKSSTRYFVTVAAGTSAGYGKRSKEIYTETIGVSSGSPKNVRFRYRKKNSLSISWESPDAHLLNGELNGHKICYSTKENGRNAKCFTIPTTATRFSYTIGNLKPSTRYFVIVAAGTSAGYGKRSKEIYTETIGVPSGSPRNVCFRYRQKYSLSISWEYPDAHLLNGELEGYKICYSTKKHDKNAKCSTVPTTATRYSFTIGNLKPSTRYFVTVAAGTIAGYGKRSREKYTETI